MNNSVWLYGYTTKQGTLAGSSFSGQEDLDWHKNSILWKLAVHQIFEIKEFLRNIVASWFVVIVLLLFSKTKNMDNFSLIDFL